MEKEIYKEVHLLPNDLNRGVIINVAQNLAPVCQIITKLASRVNKSRDR